MVCDSIANLEGKIMALETQDVLTELDCQSVTRMTNMLDNMCTEFMNYHYEIVDSLESDDAAKEQQGILDNHQNQLTDFIDC